MRRRFTTLLSCGTAVLLFLTIVVPGTYKIKEGVSVCFQPRRDKIPPVTKENQDFTAVLILTYMRSGSSLLGEIMQQHPDSFYVFEPLHMLTESFRFKHSIEFMNGTYIEYGAYNWTDISIPILRAWLKCDLENVFQRGLYDKLFLSYGKKTSILHQCFEERLQIDGIESFNYSVKFCVRKLQNLCLASRYRIVKTIRTSMRHITELMEEIPQMKILHLVRDPRDTLLSQKSRRMCGKGTAQELTNCSARYCSRLNDDILIRENHIILRNRILTVFFQDFVLRALDACKDVYKFIGMEMTVGVEEFIQNLKSNMTKSGCLICQEDWQSGKTLLNSTKHVGKWRKYMKPEFREIVDKLCKDSIIYFNYSFAIRIKK